jgi:hypothetical protein
VVVAVPEFRRHACGERLQGLEKGGREEIMGGNIIIILWVTINIAKLHARGGRLQGLEAKMEDFTQQAESFALLTKQLEMESKKSGWWERSWKPKACFGGSGGRD